MASNETDSKSMETVTIDIARDNLGALAIRAGAQNERIVISRHGKPFFALIGLTDLERLESLDAA